MHICEIFTHWLMHICVNLCVIGRFIHIAAYKRYQDVICEILLDKMHFQPLRSTASDGVISARTGNFTSAEHQYSQGDF